MSKSAATTFWFVNLIFRAFPKDVISYALILIITSLLPLGETYYFSRIVDSLINLYQNGDNQWVNAIIIITILRVFRIISRNFQKYLVRTLNLRLDYFLRKLFTFKISSLDYQHLDNKDTANLIARVREEYQWRFRDAFTIIFDIVVQLTSFLSYAIVLTPRYWYLIPLIIIGEIPGFLVDSKFNLANWKFNNDNTLKNRQTWDLANYLQSKSYLAELNINQTSEYIKNKLADIFNFFQEGRIALRKDKLPKDILTSFLSLAIITGGTLLIINDIRLGLITVGMFTFYFSTLRQTGDFFSSTIFNFVSLNEHLLYIENFQTVMELKNNIISGTIKIDTTKPPLIEFRHVSFHYPSSQRQVFRDLNLIIKPGEEIALVGVNGAGKSTLIKLLCRFYDPTEGEILINGTNLKDIDIKSWHSLMSILFQEFNVYPSLTLEENIRISAIKKHAKKEKILLSALKKADAYDFVKKYQNGLETPMSQRYGGEEPSWGQWQKIAISRIFYRNSPIMILDEPTASIDAVSESKIFNNLYKKVKGKTIIIVSHRFSTVRNAQRIIVIDKGQITEEGSHEQLMKLNGTYAHSFTLQAQGYQEIDMSKV